MPQITCIGYFDVTDATRSARPSGAIASSRRLIVGPHERLVPLLELRRAERLGDEVAVRAVLVAVHGEDEVAHELADVLGVDRRRERLGVAQHGLGVACSG